MVGGGREYGHTEIFTAIVAAGVPKSLARNAFFSPSMTDGVFFLNLATNKSLSNRVFCACGRRAIGTGPMVDTL